jgi:1-phosphofructokinase family hexose kinase
VILCVAGNPSIDKLFEVQDVVVGEIHRPDRFIALPGGKGIHVAQVASRLGARAVVTGILGGHTGQWIAEHLEEEGVEGRFVWAPAESRSSLSVASRVTGELTEFYEDGAEVSAEAWHEVEAVTEDLLAEASWLAVAGSMPPGIPEDGYARLVTRARARGVPSAVDARGPSLLSALSARPELVKINGHEAAEVLDHPVNGLSDAVEAALAVRARLGGEGHTVAVTVREGAGLVAPDGATWSGRIEVDGAYPVGSGDAFLAGLLVGLERGGAWPDALRVALGAAAANAEVPGAALLNPERARQIADAAVCERVSG